MMAMEEVAMRGKIESLSQQGRGNQRFRPCIGGRFRVRSGVDLAKGEIQDELYGTLVAESRLGVEKQGTRWGKRRATTSASGQELRNLSKNSRGICSGWSTSALKEQKSRDGRQRSCRRMDRKLAVCQGYPGFGSSGRAMDVATTAPWSRVPVLWTKKNRNLGKPKQQKKRVRLTLRAEQLGEDRKKVVVVGAGWAGLGAAYHLSKQGYLVTLLEAGAQPGGLVAGWKTATGRSVEVGIHGFWYPYKNIFSLVNELGLSPFTEWTRSSQYSPKGLEVESPIFQELPRLPSPLGTFVYTQFLKLPLWDRLSALPLLHAVVDFDNSNRAWRKYDKMTARELFRQYGCTDRVYEEAFNPMLLVGLFAPGEQCSAAATIGMLYYFILAHQPDFDVVWCRGTVGEKIFKPWLGRLRELGCRFLSGKRVTDVSVDESSGRIRGVACGNELFPADAVIFSVGVTGMQRIVSSSAVLQKSNEFLAIQNLAAVDVLGVRLWLDRKVKIRNPSNACFGFDETTGWTFFDLNALHDEYRDADGTVVEADFYHANQFLPLTDEQIVSKVKAYLVKCIPQFAEAQVVDQAVMRYPKSVTHFFPGSHQHMLRGTTMFPNLFMAGDWIVNRHGSWSQEKAYVTGLEAANRVVELLGQGEFSNIVPVEPDELHIAELRNLNYAVNGAMEQFL